MENCSPFLINSFLRPVLFSDNRASDYFTITSFPWSVSHLPYHSSRPIRRREIVSVKDDAIFKTRGAASVLNIFKHSVPGVFHYYSTAKQ